MKASASTASEKGTSAETVPSPLPHQTESEPHKHTREKQRRTNPTTKVAPVRLKVYLPTPKIKASKRKLTGEELMALVKDADDEAKDYVIQNAFMKEDF